MCHVCASRTQNSAATACVMPAAATTMLLNCLLFCYYFPQNSPHCSFFFPALRHALKSPFDCTLVVFLCSTAEPANVVTAQPSF